ncbi:MAG TPA: hypothetical protein VHF88_09370, partial [Thermoleophilaceae bacterium]|nr:hypothetical protein [Thermoleophilaceae bacterium]
MGLVVDPSASLGLMQVEMAINSAVLAWNERLSVGMTTMQTTMANGLTQLGAGSSIGLMQVESAINSSVLAWNERLQVGLTTMQTTMANGLTQ